MDSPLLQRIIGAAVLVALGVIFIPALLDGAGYKSRLNIHHIKPEPDFPPLSKKIPEHIISPLEKARKQQQQANQRQVKRQTLKKYRHKHSDKQRALHAFALQMGTFKNNANAKKLRDKLRKAGYHSFVVPVAGKNETIYKVRIGPELQKSVLEKMKKKVKKQFKIDAYVVNHS